MYKQTQTKSKTVKLLAEALQSKCHALQRHLTLLVKPVEWRSNNKTNLPYIFLSGYVNSWTGAIDSDCCLYIKMCSSTIVQNDTSLSCLRGVRKKKRIIWSDSSRQHNTKWATGRCISTVRTAMTQSITWLTVATVSEGKNGPTVSTILPADVS